MALIKCPECGAQISDQAEQCIHCGFPVKKHLSTAIFSFEDSRMRDYHNEPIYGCYIEREFGINMWIQLGYLSDGEQREIIIKHNDWLRIRCGNSEKSIFAEPRHHYHISYCYGIKVDRKRSPSLESVIIEEELPIYEAGNLSLIRITKQTSG